MTTYVSPGGTFASTNPSYSLYPVLAQIQDAQPFNVDLESNWTIPADFATQASAANAQLTCVVNPHAPSGHLTRAEQLHRIAEEISGVLLIDEAYADFIDPEIGYTSRELVEQHDNVLVLRTFSKGYSLAGLRLGYLLGNESLITPIIDKTRDSYNIDAISQRLGIAALEDQTYAQSTWARVREQRQLVAQQLSELGWTCVASETNFLLSTPPNDSMGAEAIYTRLKAENILVRYFNHPRLDDKLRISIGTEEQNQILLEHLRHLGR